MYRRACRRTPGIHWASSSNCRPSFSVELGQSLNAGLLDDAKSQTVEKLSSAKKKIKATRAFSLLLSRKRPGAHRAFINTAQKFHFVAAQVSPTPPFTYDELGAFHPPITGPQFR